MQALLSNSLLQGGRYNIIRHISSGGFGNTYEGVHTMMDTRVAIKEFFPKMFCNRDENTSHITVATQSNRELVDKLRKKFMEEAKAIFKMNHPNIVKVHDIFEENGTAYYVMDYIDGKSLGQIVKERGVLPEAEAVGYIRQVADALKYVHSLNRLHLDIKPGNVMVGGNGQAILIDFGASKHYDMESGENTSTLMGVNTKGYAPVEQSTQSFTKFSPATDIYALGATLYKLLTGITPPDANLLMAKEETLTPLPDSISLSTRNAVLKAMTLIRADRLQNIDTFLALLNSKAANSSDNEVTICEENEKARQAEEARRWAEEQRWREAEARRAAEEEARRKAATEEERKRKEEEKARNTAKKSGSKSAWLWTVIGVIVVVGIGIIIGINSKGVNASRLPNEEQQRGTNKIEGFPSIPGLISLWAELEKNDFKQPKESTVKATGMHILSYREEIDEDCGFQSFSYLTFGQDITMQTGYDENRGETMFSFEGDGTHPFALEIEAGSNLIGYLYFTSKQDAELYFEEMKKYGFLDSKTGYYYYVEEKIEPGIHKLDVEDEYNKYHLLFYVQAENPIEKHETMKGVYMITLGCQ